MHAKRAHYGMCRNKCFIVYVHFLHVNSLVSIDTSILMLNTLPGILLLECQDIEGVSDISSRVLRHFMKKLYKCKEHTLVGKYSLVERRMIITYDTIE